jgi:hypothetical protein
MRVGPPISPEEFAKLVDRDVERSVRDEKSLRELMKGTQITVPVLRPLDLLLSAGRQVTAPSRPRHAPGRDAESG